MGIELVEEVHDGVCVELRGDDNDVKFVLSSMRTVVASLLLPLDPQKRQLLELSEATTINHSASKHNHDKRVLK